MSSKQLFLSKLKTETAYIKFHRIFYRNSLYDIRSSWYRRKQSISQGDQRVQRVLNEVWSESCVLVYRMRQKTTKPNRMKESLVFLYVEHFAYISYSNYSRSSGVLNGENDNNHTFYRKLIIFSESMATGNKCKRYRKPLKWCIHIFHFSELTWE